MSDTPLLQVRGLSKAFGGVQAVDNVGFELQTGKLLALIGPNGAGKTTCFNLLNGQLKPDQGAVDLSGHSILGLPPRQIWRLGVARTFQITATFASMSVRENVQMALLSYHHRLHSLFTRAANSYKNEAMTLLDRVGMSDQSERSCGVLAYGDLKRVELAIALANQPKLLLMDEPTAGMAPRARVELMALVAGFTRDSGVAVLFTEHDMDVVFAHADEIIVLDRGRLIAHGQPEEVRNNRQVQEIYLGEQML